MPEQAWSEDEVRNRCFGLGGHCISLGAILLIGALLPTCCVGILWIEKPWATGRVAEYGNLPRFVWWAIFTGPSVVSGGLLLAGGVLMHRHSPPLPSLQRGSRLAFAGGTVGAIGAALGAGVSTWNGVSGVALPGAATGALTLAFFLGALAMASGLVVLFTLTTSRRVTELIYDRQAEAQQQGRASGENRDPFLREPPPQPDA